MAFFFDRYTFFYYAAFHDFHYDVPSIRIGYHGFILGDVDPTCGSFPDTPCVSRGRQLMDLTTKYRNLLDQLMFKVNASGSHSTGPDLILCAYERCGADLRPKDIKLFNFYMIVRDQDLAFCSGTLNPDECASQSSPCNDLTATVKSETNYAKRKKVKDAHLESLKNSTKVEHLELIKAFIKPESSTEGVPDDTLSKSVINMNNMAADESSKHIEYLDSVTKNEKAKSKMETLVNLMVNTAVFSMLAVDVQIGMRAKLTALLLEI